MALFSESSLSAAAGPEPANKKAKTSGLNILVKAVKAVESVEQSLVSTSTPFHLPSAQIKIQELLLNEEHGDAFSVGALSSVRTPFM